MDLRTWRKSKRLTLEELRRLLPKEHRSVTLSTLSRYERGEIKRRNPQLCRALAQLTGTKVKLTDLILADA